MRERVLYFEAAEITDPEARRRFLDQACGDDQALRQRLDDLLAADQRMGSFLQPDDADRVGVGPLNGSLPTLGAAHAAVTDGPPPSGDSVTEEFDSTPDLSFLQPPTHPGTLGRLAHYEVLKVIGQGGFGIVLKARDTKLEREVAIKVLQQQLAATSPPRKRFLREARACAAIQHPNVITLFAVEEQPLPYLVMELVRGSTLQDMINEAGPLEWTEILPLVHQLAVGLEKAHASGLIHRDIKPSNILVEPGPQKRMVLTDFGLARTVDDISLTRSGFIAGTPMYMSPEQADGSAVDARTDLFSLGSVLYVMVTGRPPFRAPSSAAVMRRVITAQPRDVKELIPDSPDWLCGLIARLQAKSPEDRFPSAGELVEWLERCQDDLKLAGAVRPETLLMLQTDKVIPQTASSTVAGSPFLRRGGLAIGCLAMCALLTLAALPFLGDSAEPSSTSSEPATSTALQADPPSHAPLGNDRGPAVLTVPFRAEQAAATQQAWADYLGLPVEFTNRWGITFRLIPPGKFLMGSPEKELATARTVYNDKRIWKVAVQSEAPQHMVELTQAFYLATTEVTQRQFEMIMSYNTSHYISKDEDPEGRRPVERMSWNEAESFTKRMSHRDRLISWADVFDAESRARGYRLPTEAEWEFACRGGTNTPFWTGTNERKLVLAEIVGGSGVEHPLPVASRQPNPFGLYDMHGNVREYVSDFWSSHYYASLHGQITKDPLGPADAGLTYRVHRGGDYWWVPEVTRSASRCAENADIRPGLAVGIRLAIDVVTSRRLHENLSPPWVTDFRELHNATLPQLRTWIDGLGTGFVPKRISVRSGGDELCFDAVATPNPRKFDWQVDFVPVGKWNEHFGKMRSTHAADCWVTLPPWWTECEAFEGISVWLETEQADWATWRWGVNDLESRLLEASTEGWIPVSIDLVAHDPGTSAGYCHRLRPGVGHQIRLQRSPQELARDVAEYRRRGYRPCMIQAHPSQAAPLLSAVFRENADQLPWEFTDRMSLAEYEAELKTRTADHWYPAMVYSYVESATPLYGAVWQPLATAKLPRSN